MLGHFFSLDIPPDEAGGGAGEEPVALVSGPGDVVHVAVVGEEFEQLPGVDAVVGGEAGRAHVPQRHHAVVGAAKQPGGLRAVEHQTVHSRVFLLHRLPLVEANLG